MRQFCAFKFGMKEESREKLLELSDTLYEHPDLNLSLSPDKARPIFDTITTGKPKSIQGFVAIAGPEDGHAYFPSQATRFVKSELYLLARYPVNNSRCIMPVVAVQAGPISDFLNRVEQFQGTLFGKAGAGGLGPEKKNRFPTPHASRHPKGCNTRPLSPILWLLGSLSSSPTSASLPAMKMSKSWLAPRGKRPPM